MDWQPISTAPKDGSILLYAVGADARPMHVIARWDCATHAFSSRTVCPTKNCDFRWLGEMGIRYGVVFTHWMPLPEPPRIAVSGAPEEAARKGEG